VIGSPVPFTPSGKLCGARVVDGGGVHEYSYFLLRVLTHETDSQSLETLFKNLLSC
jgi:hypothetical protein